MGIRPTVEGAPLARQGAADRAGGRRWRHPAVVWTLTALVAGGYSVFALAQYYTFRTSSYDLVIFDQAVRSFAHFKPGIAIIFNTHEGFPPGTSILANHWSPIDAALVPLYLIHDSPETLLVAQAFLFALAIPPLWAFTRRAFGGGQQATVAAYLVAAAYALSWPIASALAFDYHEVAFVPVLTAVALERLQAGKLRTALIALGALLFVKEDIGLLVAGIGLYLAVARPRTLRRQWLVGLALIAAGLAATVISTDVLIPAFGGRADFFWAYPGLGPNVSQAAVHLLTHPVSSLRLLVTPRVKLYTMLWLFGAFCFLPLRSPMALATIPLLLERMLANIFPAWWGTAYQYNAFLVVVLVCAAVDGAARLDRALARRRAARSPDAARTWPVALGCAAAMCAVGLILVPRFAFGPALHPTFYQRDANMKAAAAADAVVPSGVTVAATDNLGPQLSARDTVLLWDGERPPMLNVPWVVATVSEPQFTFRGVQAQKQRVAVLEHDGYRVVFHRGGYLVLHRAGSGTAGRGRAAG
jgi:uncharacterized membrane protein